jgi:hypothetical protein
MTKIAPCLALVATLFVTPAIAGPSGQHSAKSVQHSGQASSHGSAALSTGAAIVSAVPLVIIYRHFRVCP